MYDCTRNDRIWKSQKITQLAWRCKDCQGNEEYICDFCAKKCHIGHTLENLGTKSDVVCDCYSSQRGCKSLKYCTLSLDKNSHHQSEHQCKTCNLEALCSYCSKNCHKSHKTEKKSKNFIFKFKK